MHTWIDTIEVVGLEVNTQKIREHLVEPFNFLFSDTTAASVFVTAGTSLLRFSFP
jgi:hypothetical protein